MIMNMHHAESVKIKSLKQAKWDQLFGSQKNKLFIITLI